MQSYSGEAMGMRQLFQAVRSLRCNHGRAILWLWGWVFNFFLNIISINEILKIKNKNIYTWSPWKLKLVIKANKHNRHLIPCDFAPCDQVYPYGVCTNVYSFGLFVSSQNIFIDYLTFFFNANDLSFLTLVICCLVLKS